MLAPFALATSLASGFDPTPRRVGALIALGVVNTGIAYWLNYGAIAKVGATAASLVTYLIPPIAIVLGWIVLGEPVGWRLVVGLVLIVAGVAAVRRVPTPSRRRRRPCSPPADGARSWCTTDTSTGGGRAALHKRA